jgi:hypothetical protein
MCTTAPVQLPVNAEAEPYAGPPDFILEFFRTAGREEWNELFTSAPPFFLLGGAIVLLVAVVLWVRGISLRPGALVVYFCPILLGFICFSWEIHWLGANLGYMHGYVSDMRPFFELVFGRLCLGFFLSFALLIVATLLRAFQYLLGRRKLRSAVSAQKDA